MSKMIEMIHPDATVPIKVPDSAVAQMEAKGYEKTKPADAGFFKSEDDENSEVKNDA